jgi:hypothetical protein
LEIAKIARAAIASSERQVMELAQHLADRKGDTREEMEALGRARKSLQEALLEVCVIEDENFAQYANLGDTCDRCARAATCPCAFDGYNTDGDCLASK